MNNTSLTLLQHAQSGSREAWGKLDAIYRPFLRRWFHFRAIQPEAAEDLTQQVLLILSRELPNFEHSGRVGSLRRWLRTTAIYEEKAYRRKQSIREQPVGGSGFNDQVHDVEIGDDRLSRHWDDQHDNFVLEKLLGEIGPDFEPKTLAAFQRLALQGESVDSVSIDLNMSVGAIYVAKSRVLRRLRLEAKGLVDEVDI